MRQNTSVLIVDDDAHLRKALTDILKGKGYQPIPCSTGQEALDKLKQSVPSLALIDLRIEDIPGVELLRKIKDRSPETECIILTGYASQKSAIKAVNLGAYSYLKKPYDIDELLVTLQRVAEKRETKRALQWSEERFRTLVENANDIIYTHDLKGNFTSVNPAATRTFGYSQKEIIKMNIAQVVDPKYLPLARDKVQEKLKGVPVTVPYELLTYSKEGRPIWVEVSTRLLEREGRPLEVQGIARDISQRKRAEEALREERDKAQKYLNIAGVMLVAINTKGEVTLINQKGCEILGYEQEAIIGKNWFDNFLPERIRDKTKNVSEKLLTSEIESVEYFENPVLTKSGEERVIEWHNSVLRDKEDKVIGHLSSGTDITERKRAEEALRESEDRFRSLVETTSDWIWEVDVKGVYTYASPRVKDVLGYDPEEVIGKTCFDLMPPKEAKHVKQEFSAVAKQEKPIARLENTNLHKDGRSVILETSAVPIFDADGHLCGYRGIDRDITDRKKAEEEKEKLQAQLLQAQKMESIGILAGGIAHNFNNILTAIQGFADLSLMQVEESTPLYRDLKQISTSVTRAADLTRQLLTFSRKYPTSLTPLDLNQTIKNLIKMLSSLIGEDITIETDLEPHLWPVEADESQMEQVMMNLVTNAKEAMPEGGRLFIQTENLHVNEEYAKRYPEARPGRFIRLSLQDSGVGMDKETLSHIFEPFFTTKGMAVSTGLGLSVIHGIVTQHLGWINVYSEPKKGSIFKIYLPASLGKEKEELQERVSLKMLQGRGEKILLVEDEEAVRTYLTRALSENGYQVREAKDAREALHIFSEEKKDFQLIFADVILPDRNALSLANELVSQKPGLCFLFSSGYTDVKSQSSLIKRQGFPFLQKPYSLRDLLRMVRRVLEPH